ncbi:Tetracycline resistance protein, TetA/multidrug resistance protein MdtG [Syntrophomonas zehnderi OL-4]|uniref:Tetracycline resistance protein, TetA/multidrug resistance protein MdtG n=1 Tax=Syntrophomonas zehnderi OL-4 TaxID=690567 RepID=A0A0E4GFE2_9FIRM|nr:MFS transporter [Syntrophomonas zehnderi]CFY07659.1 Tetracycline resistance protein, TetA/multidrug resistance protein MdtG [Syntrophomonas zehnderi OL-4]
MINANDNRKRMVVLFATIFLVGIGFSIIMPVLPYYAESMGASAFQLGMLITVYAVCQFIFAPVWGAYSDKVGRKPVLLLGILGYSVTFILFGFATQLWMLYVIRIVGGILACATMPTAMAYVGDTTSLKKRGSAMGMIGASMGIGMVFGPAIGGLLSSISLAFPFVFAGLLALANAISVYILLPESLANENRVISKVERASLLDGLKTPLVVLFLFICLGSIGESIHHGTFALFAEQKLAFTARDIGWAFTAAGIVMALVQGFLVGRLINRLGEEKTAATGIILMGISFGLFIFMYNIPTSIAFMAVFSAGVGLMRPSVSAAVSKRTVTGQGSAMGILNGYDSLGRAIGPMLGGFMLDRGLNMGYYCAITISLLALLTLVIGSRITANQGEGSFL